MAEFNAYGYCEFEFTPLGFDNLLSDNIVTGESTSRLSELKKYTKTGDLFNQYKLSTGSSVDGVDKNLSDLSACPQKIQYYLGGITYIDFVYAERTRTIFKFVSEGYSSPDFIIRPIVKNPDKHNIVENPKIDSDVFIVRQKLSVFDKNYKLRDIQSLVDLTSYAAGKFFNVINNT